MADNVIGNIELTINDDFGSNNLGGLNSGWFKAGLSVPNLNFATYYLYRF